jgi:hypothetical protein
MFRRAERKKAKLRLALYGITNSGKTYSALEIATGMGGKIAMIDTESGRGELYAPNFEYDVMRIEAPYSSKKYVEAIKAAEKAGYEILIIDSLSHAWAGAGGILSVVDNSGSNKFGGWKDATPLQNELLDTIVNSKLHVIVTMRAKAEWVLQPNEKGKLAPQKVGMGFIQRDGVDYEFTVVMQMSPEKNMAFVEKDNTHNYNQSLVHPTKEMGEKFMNWLNTGVDDKDRFIAALPGILDEIAGCQTLDELKDSFTSFYNLYAEKYSEEFLEVIHAKDKRKTDLINIEFPDIEMPTPLPVSKYPQTLNQLAQGNV